MASAEQSSTAIAPKWAGFLQEHADYERKFSSYILAIIGKYTDKVFAIEPLSVMAVGTLNIYLELYGLMKLYHVQLLPETPQNLYLKQLLWLTRTGREEKLLDKLLLGSLAETRCAEKFKTVADEIEIPDLMAFYMASSRLKKDYADTLMELAYEGNDVYTVNARMAELKTEEEKMLINLRGAAGIF